MGNVEWKQIELKDIGRIITGNTPPRSNPKNYGGDFPWIKTPDLDKNKYISSSSDYISEEGKSLVRILPKGSVMVSSIGIIGKVGISDCEVCTNQQINSIVPYQDIVVSEFIYYYFKRFRKEIGKKASKAVVPMINKNNFSKLKIPIPFKDNKADLETQKKIVEKLELVEKLKENREKSDELTKEYLNSVFLDMFGDPRTNPKGFETKTWSDVLEVKNGKDQKKVSKNIGKYPVYGSGGLMEYTTDYLAPENSVIIGRKGSINNPILIKEKFWNVDTAFALVPDKIKLNYNYLLYFCIYFNFFKLNKSTTLPSLTKMDLLKIKIPTPPISLQNKFAQIVEEVEELKKFQEKSKENINNLYNKLIQDAFKGEL